jgi:hypothetical protein
MLSTQLSIWAGVSAMNAPRPWPFRISNVLIHLVFGAGLSAGWVFIDWKTEPRFVALAVRLTNRPLNDQILQRSRQTA